LCNVAACWLYWKINSRCTEPWTSKKLVIWLLCGFYNNIKINSKFYYKNLECAERVRSSSLKLLSAQKTCIQKMEGASCRGQSARGGAQCSKCGSIVTAHCCLSPSSFEPIMSLLTSLTAHQNGDIHMPTREDAYRDLVGEPAVKRSLWRPRLTYVNNRKTGLEEIGLGGIDRIYLAKDWDKWRALVFVEIKI
jgi:hypothetical protein